MPQFTNQWTRNGGQTFVHEGCNIQVGRKMYRNVKAPKLIELGYVQKVIEYVPESELPSYQDAVIYYQDYERDLFVHYEAEVVEPEPEISE